MGHSTLQWRHNGRDGVSNHQPHDCLLNRLFRRRSKKTSKLRVTGLCAGNSPGTGEFSAQMASCAENVSIWWHASRLLCLQVVTWYIYSNYDTPKKNCISFCTVRNYGHIIYFFWPPLTHSMLLIHYHIYSCLVLADCQIWMRCKGCEKWLWVIKKSLNRNIKMMV